MSTQKAKNSSVPYFVVLAMAAAGLFADGFVYFQQGRHSLDAIATHGLVAVFFVVLCATLVVNFRKNQSIELSDEGVRGVDFVFWIGRFRGYFLKWEDVASTKMAGHQIYLVAKSGRKIIINTLFFANPATIVDVINKGMAASKKS